MNSKREFTPYITNNTVKSQFSYLYSFF
jgi:hypothetical protein